VGSAKAFVKLSYSPARISISNPACDNGRGRNLAESSRAGRTSD
jgi:hypothetical protein